MAWTQFRSGSFRILFRHGGRQHAFTIGGVSQAEANAKAAHVDYLLMRLRQVLIELPDGVDVVSFVEQDGRAVARREGRVAAGVGEPRDAPGPLSRDPRRAQEQKTLYTRQLHFRHFARILGERLSLSELNHATLQHYVNRRSTDGVSPTTIRTELRHAPRRLELGPPGRACPRRVARPGAGLPQDRGEAPVPDPRRDRAADRRRWADGRAAEGAVGIALPDG